MPADLVITGTTLIDGTGTPPRAGITVAIRDGSIAAGAPDGEIEIDASARAIAAVGKHVIPGLADMHVHYGRGGGLPNSPQSVERVLRQFLFYGVPPSSPRRVLRAREHSQEIRLKAERA
jgi:N-acyl-D-aspartate/D-glutamate deacylase